MRQLHPVARSADGGQLLLSADPARRPDYQVAVDGRLRALLASDPAPAEPAPPTHRGGLTPRDVQARLRAGDSLETVAAAAGWSVDHVRRYAGPVESEQAQVIAVAQQAAVAGAPRELARRTLLELVTTALSTDRGNQPEPTWTARRRADGCWVVSVGQDGTAAAEWLWHPLRSSVAPLEDRAARIAAGGRPADPAQTGDVEPPAAATATPPAVPAELADRAGPPAAAPDQVVDQRLPPVAVVAERGSRPSRSGAQRRVPVPSWSDVLLGVRPTRPGAPEAGAEEDEEPRARRAGA